MKNYIAIILALSLFACADPKPTPVPTPSPSVSPSPSPSPSHTPPVEIGRASFTANADVAGVYSRDVHITAAINETRGVWLRVEDDNSGFCPVQATTGVVPTFFKAELMTAAKPSFIGAPSQFYDKLQPVDYVCEQGMYFVDLTGFGNLQIGTASIWVTHNGFTLPARPTMPLYISLDPSFANVLGLAGHVSTQGPAIQAAVDLLRKHRIEPYKQYLALTLPVKSDGTLNVDQWQEFGASYRQLVLDGAIANPFVVVTVPATPAVSQLQAVQKTIAAGVFPPHPMAYGFDEGQLSPPGPALARSNLIKTNCPDCNLMWTREEDTSSAFASLDTFCPILDWFKQPGHVQNYSKPYGLYTACFAQGGCSGPVRNPSGSPMMVGDAPAVHPFAFPIVAASLGAQYALYYAAVDGFGKDLAYKDNGNGDGQLLYADMVNKRVLPSVRLKLLREGMNTVEYLKRDPSAFAGLVSSGLVWSKNYAAYLTARGI